VEAHPPIPFACTALYAGRHAAQLPTHARTPPYPPPAAHPPTILLPPRTKMVTALVLGQPSMTSMRSRVVPNPISLTLAALPSFSAESSCSEWKGNAGGREEVAGKEVEARVGGGVREEFHESNHLDILCPGKGAGWASADSHEMHAGCQFGGRGQDTCKRMYKD
jgi:hypothetical protein